MDSSDATSSSSGGGGGGNRLSKLNDRALGHVLSFLPAAEAARAAVLSSRWRHVFAAVHTLSLEEPESTDDDDGDDYPDYSSWSPPPDPNAPPSFFSTVSAAIICRQRRRGAVPLRALRVAVEESYSGGDSNTVDQWVSYAVQHAAAEGLDLDLRLLCRSTICDHPYVLRRHGQQEAPTASTSRDGDDVKTVHDMVETPSSRIDAGSKSSELNDDDDDDDSTVMSSEDERKKPSDPWWIRPKPEYTATRVIFSCAHLRSLSLSSCRLAPPDTVSLPSLVTLLLSHVSDPGSDVERVVAGCPRLADLTLEACNAVTALSTVVGGGRLRRLAIRCCHSLTAITVDSSELQEFEYRGAVPGSSFLTLHGGGGGCTKVAYCKVDICGEEATSKDELVNLRQLLGLFENAKRLHLESARLGSDLDMGSDMRLPSFSSLLHLEIRGCLPDDDDAGADPAGAAIIGAMSTVLEHAPNLETLSLAFHPQPPDQERHAWLNEEELLDAHHLSYNPHSVLAAATTTTTSAMTMIPCCLRNKVREINLVHYHGSTAQRALAKFLLSNAAAIQMLWCEFAEGPMWTQMQLTREIKGWLINKSADTHFA